MIARKPMLCGGVGSGLADATGAGGCIRKSALSFQKRRQMTLSKSESEAEGTLADGWLARVRPESPMRPLPVTAQCAQLRV